MHRYYLLEGHEAVPIECDSVTKWAEASEARYADPSGDPWRVARTDDLPGQAWVSTVFLGLNHAWDDGHPLLFETMVFGGPCDGDQERCSTWEQAEAQHAEVVARCLSREDQGGGANG